jgi:hypothetical protein
MIVLFLNFLRHSQILLQGQILLDISYVIFAQICAKTRTEISKQTGKEAHQK